jgi:hypothetical protein
MMGFHVLLLCASAINVSAQLEVSSGDEPQACFGGERRTIRIFVRNSGAGSEEKTLRTRVYQASSSTIMPLGEAQPWKKLTVLGGQTLLESATVNFPEVRAATRFYVRWLDDGGKSIGQTRVTVYPAKLLKELTVLSGEKPFGIFDPQERITPLLKRLEIEFVDLTEGERLDSFQDRLAIIMPGDTTSAPPGEWHKRVPALTTRGVSVVLIARSLPATRASNHPLIFVNGPVVSMAPEVISDLETNPTAQETLLQCARLALNHNLSVHQP